MVKRPRKTQRRPRSGWRWAVALGGCAAAAVVAVATGRVELQALPLPDAFTAGRKAVVRFETPPRTEIRIDDGAPVGHSEPVALPPGTHHVVFKHPRLGRAERTFDVEAGEERLVKNVFETSERSARR